MEETIIYSIRIDAFSPPLRLAWFTTRNIENDERPKQPPKLLWITSRQLEITTTTRTVNGMLAEHVGDDLIVVRKFVASKPDAFPNFGP